MKCRRICILRPKNDYVILFEVIYDYSIREWDKMLQILQ